MLERHVALGDMPDIHVSSGDMYIYPAYSYLPGYLGPVELVSPAVWVWLPTGPSKGGLRYPSLHIVRGRGTMVSGIWGDIECLLGLKEPNT